MAGASGFGANNPKFPQPFGAPRIAPPTRLPDGRTLSPLKGPAVPLPGDQEADLQARWEVWKNRRTGSGTGSVLEFICYEFLVKNKRQVENVDFVYQVPMLGGRNAPGGFVADFWLPQRKLVWNPAGLRFHNWKTTDRYRDKISRYLLAARGINVIFLWEDDLINRPIYTMEKAWQGREIPHL